MAKILKRIIRQQAYVNPSGQRLGDWFRLLTEETSQVNLIMLNPRTFDGWYTHGERGEWHLCLKGNVLIAQHDLGIEPTGEQHPQAVYVPNLVWHGIYNESDDPAWILICADQVHNRGDDEFPLPVQTGELETLATLWAHYYGGTDDDTE